MPKFILEHGSSEARKRFQDLDTFTQGYVEAAFWTESEPGTDRDSHDPERHSSLPGDVTFDDLAPEALESIIEDCRDFQKANAEDLAEAYDNGGINGYDESHAGHDFWLTRNGHGAGFWDRGLGDVGDKLSKMSKPYGSCNLYLGDDSKVYCD